MDKLDKAVVLYMPAKIIEAAGAALTRRYGAGACCGKCVSLDGDDLKTCAQFAKAQGTVSAGRGVCGIFAPGEPSGSGSHALTKEMVGYIEVGPTMCERCRFIGVSAGMPQGVHPCERVKGDVEDGGCCNSFKKG